MSWSAHRFVARSHARLSEAAFVLGVGVLACSGSDHGAGAPSAAGANAAYAGANAGPAGTGGSNAAAGGVQAGGAGAGGSGALGASAGRGTARGGAGAGAKGGSSGAGRANGGAPSAGAGGVAGEPAVAAGAAGAASVTGTPTLFWLDVSGKVMWSDATKFAAKTLVPSAGQGSDGIAVDVPGGHIYWTNMGVPADDDGSVMRSDLDGSHVTTIIATGGTYTPKQLKLEPTQGKLYWSDREGMRVMRANLDGSELETLYTSGQGDTARADLSNWCVGIAVDIAGGYFYWSQKGPDDGQAGSLRRAHLTLPAGADDVTRSDVEILYEGLAAPIDIDLDLDAGFIYWTDRGDNTVNRGPLELASGATPATRTDREILVPNVPQAIGIFLDHERGLIYYTDAVGDVGRANFDGTGAEFELTKAGAFTGIVSVDLPAR